MPLLHNASTKGRAGGEGLLGSLTERYLQGAEDAHTSKGSTFGKPFRFGMQLPLTFNRSPPEYLAGLQWHSLDYLDPARAWRKGQDQAPTVKASVTNHSQQRGGVAQEQAPPPAAVTISKVPTFSDSGVRLNRTAGTCVREYGAVVPSGLDGSFMVFERLEPPDVRRRIAGTGGQQMAPGRGGLRCLEQFQLQNQGAGVGGPLGPLQRVMQAWATEEQAEQCGPGPAQADVGNKPVSALGGPAYTMGARTKPVGQSLQERDAALAPGPGQYEVAGSGPSGPAYTIKGKPKEQPPESANIPGPGAYLAEVPSVGVGPAYTISGRTKVVTDEKLPGPGDYNVAKSTNSGPAHTITSRPKPPPIEVLPGPADYQKMEAPRTGPAYTIAPRTEPKLPGLDVPAPGEYELPEAWKEGPAFSIAPRTQTEGPRDISPGPGQYSHPRSPDGPAYTIAGRPPQPEPPESPGPTDYQSTTLPPGGPAYSLGGKPASSIYALEEEAMLPGPGQYTVPLRPSAPAYTMAGRTTLPEQHPPDSPGPAAYGLPPDPRLPSAPAFTMGPRVSVPEPAPDSPGPAEYQAADYMPAGPAYTMAGRPADRQPSEDDLPGPGDYDVDGPGSRGPAFSIPQAGASGSPKVEEPASPGPGEYEVPLPPQGPAYTINTTGRPQPKTDDGAPGPGDYAGALDAMSNRGPAYTIAGRPAEKPLKEVLPGPGEYEAPPSPTGPAYTIAPRTELPQDKQDPVVGPGYYDPQEPSSAPAYTMAPKIPLPRDKSQDGMPGPGYYGDVPAPRGPAYTMAGPFPPEKALLPGLDSPGPAAYAQDLGPGGPAYTIAGKPKEAAPKEEGPGPGEYGGIESPPGGPAYTIQGRYPVHEPPSSPGPGDYTQVLKPPEGPAYTIAPKLPAKGPAQADSPAPGIYGAPGQDLIGQSGPAYTMAGKSPSKPDRVAEGPGPGEYTGPSSPSGPAWTLGARIPTNMPSQGADSPGPGTYAPPIGPDGPAYTLAPRVNVPSPNQDNPAPGDYGAPGPTGPSGPAYTLGGKAKEPDPRMGLMGPGPGEHQAVLLPPEGPAFTLGKRSKRKAARSGPAPGQYYRAPGPSGPAYTLAPRTTGQHTWTNPVAPGDYTDPLAGSPTGPAFTLRPKHVDPQPDMKPGPGQYDFSHFTHMPPTSSILKTRPQGRAEYLVSQFAYGNRDGPADTIGAAFPEHGRDRSAGRPGVRRKVCFTDNTRFRDSTEAAAGGTSGGGAATSFGPGPPQARHKGRPFSAPRTRSDHARSGAGPAPTGRVGGRPGGAPQSAQAGKAWPGTGAAQRPRAQQGSHLQKEAHHSGRDHRDGKSSKYYVGYPRAMAAATAAEKAAAAAGTPAGGHSSDPAWARAHTRAVQGGAGRAGEKGGLLARYTTQPAGSTFSFSPPRGGGPYSGVRASDEDFIGYGREPQQQLPLQQQYTEHPQQQQQQHARPAVQMAQPAPTYLSGVIEAQQQLNRQVHVAAFGAGTAAAQANAQNEAYLTGAAGSPVVGFGRQAQSGATLAERQGGRQAAQPPPAAVLRTHASTTAGPSQPQPGNHQQQQPTHSHTPAAAQAFSFQPPLPSQQQQQHGTASGDVGESSFAFDVPAPRAVSQPSDAPSRSSGAHSSGVRGSGGRVMAMARERMASHASPQQGK